MLSRQKAVLMRATNRVYMDGSVRMEAWLVASRALRSPDATGTLDQIIRSIMALGKDREI